MEMTTDDIYIEFTFGITLNKAEKLIANHRDLFTSELLKEILIDIEPEEDIMILLVNEFINEMDSYSITNLLYFNSLDEENSKKLWEGGRDKLNQDEIIKILVGCNNLKTENILLSITKELTIEDFSLADEMFYGYDNTLNKLLAETMVKDMDKKDIYSFYKEQMGENIIPFIADGITSILTLEELILFRIITTDKEAIVIIDNTMTPLLSSAKKALGINESD